MRNVIFCVTVALTYAVPSLAQTGPQMIDVPLSRPGEPYTLSISAQSADIEVIGEDREDFQFSVRAESSNRKIITPSGAQSIAFGSYSFEVDENDNNVSVDTDWRANKIHIIAHVPRNGDLDLSTVNDGSIIVSNITGNLELENTNGPISASDISGSVIAESVNDTIDVSFANIVGSEVMALLSINGDLNLGIPGDAGVQLHIDSNRGEIYSDFEVDVQPSEPVIERRDDRGGVEVRVESVIIANVNGGGAVIRLKTLNGNINIRNSNN